MAACSDECRNSRIAYGSLRRLEELVHQMQRCDVRSIIRVQSAGFRYTGNGDTARCSSCDLELSGWAREKDPFRIHAEKRPNCAFVRSRQSERRTLPENGERQTDFTNNHWNSLNQELEADVIRKVRVRTFSHWTNRRSIAKRKLIKAGFFSCNVGDRVICLYCNLICQSWQKDTDDPAEVHRTLSPKCAYVLSHSMTEDTPPENEISSEDDRNQEDLLIQPSQSRSNEVSSTPAHHIDYINISKRHLTFKNWTHEHSPSVDDLVKAGFFYNSTQDSIICFHCNGSLKNWSNTTSPLIAHIKSFPQCAYAKQVAGESLYNKVHEADRNNQEPETLAVSVNTSSSQRLQITDEKVLSRFVAARLDLPISQRLLNQNFKLSVIKRCWEDQLRFKHDDFVSDCDLFIACLILQNQIKFIDGNRDNITIPSEKMKAIRAKEQSDTMTAEQSPPTTSSTMNSSNNPSATTNDTSDESELMDTTNAPQLTQETTSETKLSLNNPCLSCGKQEKRLACIPCGHLATCVDCSKTLSTCFICRRGIEAFVRIFL